MVVSVNTNTAAPVTVSCPQPRGYTVAPPCHRTAIDVRVAPMRRYTVVALHTYIAAASLTMPTIASVIADVDACSIDEAPTDTTPAADTFTAVVITHGAMVPVVR
ncbi:MAG: hypothetical protein WC732_09670 [Candidatus Omnitrophota bacterium]